MLITKANGKTEEFNSNKLRTSLKRAGAHKDEVDKIVTEIERTILDEDKTQVIYRKAFEMLRRSKQPVAAKYSLRRALFGLGPTGFPFEDFLARLFEAEGYKTKVRLELKGKCALHEIDVAAYSKKETFIAEAKFHMRPGIKSDLQVAMYSYARFLDLRATAVCREDKCGVDDMYIITNTKFTKTARDYAKCVGIKLLSWNYPHNNNLQKRIEKAGVYPVTALTTLPNNQKRVLLESGIILCKELLANPKALKSAGVKPERAVKILDEASQLCATGKK